MNRADDECYTGTGPAAEVGGAGQSREPSAVEREEWRVLRKWAETSWQRGFRQGLDTNRLLATKAMEALKKEREARAETNRAMTDALLMMEEREQRDEALLRQALERLEAAVEHFDPYMGDNECRPMENARYTITALRDRLGKGMDVF